MRLIDEGPANLKKPVKTMCLPPKFKKTVIALDRPWAILETGSLLPGKGVVK
jgi:hypothetical protein